jgi:ppGpp synthetase/RelA/SpoT-type nucleotidyltranferase
MNKELGAKINELVAHYDDNRSLFNRALINLEGYVKDSRTLRSLIHSTKYRTKDPDHLRDKLMRKALKAADKGEEFSITPENLFLRINDLAGYRILHLHTTQFREIDLEIKRIFSEEAWAIIEGPEARTWDDESREYFTSIGTTTLPHPNLYTSVHYIIQPNSRITCELQVRTLMEEVWGEVDHTINYPHKTESVACSEQIKALARATSTCSRLVDSIFASYKDYRANFAAKKPASKKAVIKKKP